MNFKNYLFRLTLAVLIFSAPAAFAQATKSTAPRQEKLLNGLKLLIWNDPAAAKATVKLRIHSGAAFDTLGKEGTMAMLADVMFPNASVKEFFSEELGGSLDVESNYDYIQISATGDADKVLTILETLAAAVTKPAIDKETTDKIRAARLERIKTLEANPSYVADLAVAKRLFGNYPYGRSAEGTAESIQKIDFADLLLAKQRFLTADNATLAVSGNVKPDFVFKATRQLFGGWEKADKKVPATFAQPDAPTAETLLINLPNAEKSFWRYAIPTAARNSQNYYATQILADIWSSKLACSSDDSKIAKGSSEFYLLSGIYIVGTDLPPSLAEEPPSSRERCPIQMMDKNGKLIFPVISQSDFDIVKARIVFELNEKAQSPTAAADLWLDVDTYKLGTIKDEIQKANKVTLADVQKIAEDLQKQPPAQVAVRKTAAS